MANINELSSTDTPSSSDLLPIWTQQNGDTRKISLANFLAWIYDSLTSFKKAVSVQRAEPSPDQNYVYFDAGPDDAWLIIRPTAGTGVYVTLPAVGTCADGQEVVISCARNEISTLVIQGNGATVSASVETSLPVGRFQRLRFDAQLLYWHVV